MDREKVISTFEKIISVCKEDGCDFVDLTFEDAEQILAMLKEQDAVVRCKDCKHGKQLFEDYVSCQISEENESGCHVSHKPDWFCADGERRTDDG